MKKFLETIYNLFSEDTTGEGESIKLVVVLRELEFALVVYGIINVIASIIYGMYSSAGSFGVVILAFSILLHLSYKVKSNYHLVLFNLVSVVGITAGVFAMGTDTHMQNHLIVLMVIDFFAHYGYYKRKAIISLVICAVYLYLHVSPLALTGCVPVPEQNYMAYKVINGIFVFINMGIVSYVYSKNSQVLDGKLVEYNNKLKKQASTDALTGLCNRRTAVEFINSLIEERSASGFCVCMCDIDFFKKVNDSYGHDIGDNVLNGVATTMVEGFPKDCLTARWGGEEFLVIFPHMNGDDAKMLLDIMRSKIKALEFTAGEKKFGITVTYGLAEYGFDDDAEKIVKQADEKLYMGKQNGRDQVVY